jgi:hypothetical protein
MAGADESQRVKIIVEGSTARIEGDETVYYCQVVGHLRLEVQDIRCSQHYSSLYGKASDTRSLRGSALLGDRSILGIIGTDDFRTSVVSISIRPDSDETLKDRIDNESNAIGVAFICFFEADWELSTKNEWSVEVRLPDAIFGQLYESTCAGRIKQLEINTLLGEAIYTRARFAPHNFSHTWRLCPRDGKVTRPEPAWAQVDWLSATEQPRELIVGDQFSHPARQEEGPGSPIDETDIERRTREASDAHRRQVLSLLLRMSRSLLWIAAAVVFAAVLVRAR